MNRIILVMFQLLLALWKVYGSHHDIVNRYEMSLSQMTKNMFPLSWSQSWQIFDNCNTAGATVGAGIAYPSGAPEFTSVFLWGLCCSIWFFYILFCWLLLACFVFFPMVITLSVLQFMASDYYFGIFNIVLRCLPTYSVLCWSTSIYFPTNLDTKNKSLKHIVLLCLDIQYD